MAVFGWLIPYGKSYSIPVEVEDLDDEFNFIGFREHGLNSGRNNQLHCLGSSHDDIIRTEKHKKRPRRPVRKNRRSRNNCKTSSMPEKYPLR